VDIVRIEAVFVDKVDRRTGRRNFLAGRHVDRLAPAAVGHGDRIHRTGIDDAGQVADQRQILGERILRVELRAEAIARDHERVGLVHAARPGHRLEALADDEQGVADDCQCQRDLQADEDQRNLAAHQGGNDWADFHGLPRGSI
jgi:hypothetical protein